MLRILLPCLWVCLVACASRHEATDAGRNDARLQVAFVVVDGVYDTELTAPLDVLHHSAFHAEPGMRVFLVGPSLDPITSFEGLRILPDFTFDTAPRIDVLVVPSAEHSMDTDLEDERLMRFVRQRGARAEWLMSLCDGAFVLAAAGLLDGLETTTFPGDIERFREMFPHLVVHEDVSFVLDGNALTSAGGALSFEPALYLAELCYGPEAARGIARGLCIEWNAASVPHVVGPNARTGARWSSAEASGPAEGRPFRDGTR